MQVAEHSTDQLDSRVRYGLGNGTKSLKARELKMKATAKQRWQHLLYVHMSNNQKIE